MDQKDLKNKKGCFGCSGCLPLLFIIIFGIKILPDLLLEKQSVVQENYESENISFYDGHYNIKSLDNNSKIIDTNYSWSFITSNFNNKNINLSIEVIESDVKEALEILESLYYMTDEELNLKIDYTVDPNGGAAEFWGAIYRIIATKTGSQVGNIAKSLKEIAINEKLDSNDLLWMTITMVQNITYQIPEEEFGIIPPIVSIAREYGDCDTIALLLHSILEEMGYDTVLYYSRVYGHAMLGISTNGSGEYKTLNGLNYYFLEVTNPGWNIGQISSDWDNMDNWFIIEL